MSTAKKKPVMELAADILTVDMTAVAKLVKKGSDIVATAQAEEALLTLLKMQEKINWAVGEAKSLIEKKGLEYNPNFTSVQGSRIKVGYQFFGGKYAIDSTYLDKLPKDLYKQETKYSPVGAAIDKFAKENNKLPLGIVLKDRKKTITIKQVVTSAEEEE